MTGRKIGEAFNLQRGEWTTHSDALRYDCQLRDVRQGEGSRIMPPGRKSAVVVIVLFVNEAVDKRNDDRKVGYHES